MILDAAILAGLLHLVAAGAAADSGAPPPSPAVSDTAKARRVVRRFEEIVVRAPFHDPRSSETVHLISRESQSLPVDGLRDLIALEPGVVVRGEDLHVRGGRAGELAVEVNGVALNEPLRGRPMEIPLLAVRDAELVTGGMDANYRGALAGVLDVHPVEPGARLGGVLRWSTDGRLETEYDRVAGRLDGPTGVPGLGFVAAAEATLDGTALPSLRSVSRTKTALGKFGWRDDNRLLGYLQLSPRGSSPWKLQGFASRIVERPYDPMWSVDAWIDFCPEGDSVCAHPSIRPDPAPGHTYYRAADHNTMTDERRLLGLLTMGTPPGPRRVGAALAWARDRAVTSLDGRDDESYLWRDERPYFGATENPDTDPFLIYAGDEPYFRRTGSDVVSLRVDASNTSARGTVVRGGFGAEYQTLAEREIDMDFPRGSGIDSVRDYRAWAPDAFAYVQSRWEFQGLILNAGARVQRFAAGAMAGRTLWPVPDRAFWTLSPRLGLAYPMSTRDVFSLAYVRIHQDPERDFLYENRTTPLIHRPLGNPLLEPSEVISYQTGLKHAFDERWSAQLGFFYRDLFGQIGARRVSLGVNRLRFQNAAEGHAMGFEVSTIRRAGGDRIEAHYTWLHALGTESREEGVPAAVVAARAIPLDDHPLDWDQRQRLALAGLWHPWRRFELAWTSVLGSGLPWTPSPRRRLDADLSALNTRRLDFSERTDLAVRFHPPRAGALAIGVEVRNLFDWRGDLETTVDGYPNPLINTIYDDYSAYRTETGNGGGAYWDDANGDGIPGWAPVHDPRLSSTPRAIRATIEVAWGGIAD